MKSERDVVAHIIKNFEYYFPNADLITTEFPILGCVTRTRIGSVDFAFRTGKNRTYLVEAKNGSHSSSDVWGAMKVLGYSKSMSLTNANQTYCPVILVPQEALRYDFLPVLYHLRCGYIGFKITESWDGDALIRLNINLTPDSVLRAKPRTKYKRGRVFVETADNTDTFVKNSITTQEIDFTKELLTNAVK